MQSVDIWDVPLPMYIQCTYVMKLRKHVNSAVVSIQNILNTKYLFKVFKYRFKYLQCLSI